MNTPNLLAALVLAAAASGPAAEELTADRAAELLQPSMSQDCGSYYTEQGDPAFDDLDGKALCRYQPRVTQLSVNGASARASFNRDRHFDEALSQAWLKDYAAMAAKGTPSIIYKRSARIWTSGGPNRMASIAPQGRAAPASTTTARAGSSSRSAWTERALRRAPASLSPFGQLARPERLGSTSGLPE